MNEPNKTVYRICCTCGWVPRLRCVQQLNTCDNFSIPCWPYIRNKNSSNNNGIKNTLTLTRTHTWEQNVLVKHEKHRVKKFVLAVLPTTERDIPLKHFIIGINLNKHLTSSFSYFCMFFFSCVGDDWAAFRSVSKRNKYGEGERKKICEWNEHTKWEWIHCCLCSFFHTPKQLMLFSVRKWISLKSFECISVVLLLLLNLLFVYNALFRSVLGKGRKENAKKRCRRHKWTHCI